MTRREFHGLDLSRALDDAKRNTIRRSRIDRLNDWMDDERRMRMAFALFVLGCFALLAIGTAQRGTITQDAHGEQGSTSVQRAANTLTDAGVELPRKLHD